jgi:frataxin-like iron-binding protein CyaY
LANGSRIIVTATARHGDLGRAKSGGYHFRPESAERSGNEDGEDLLRILARCIAEQAAVL